MQENYYGNQNVLFLYDKTFCIHICLELKVRSKSVKSKILLKNTGNIQFRYIYPNKMNSLFKDFLNRMQNIIFFWAWSYFTLVVYSLSSFEQSDKIQSAFLKVN